MVGFFDGDTIPDRLKQDLLAFADRPAALGLQTDAKPQPAAVSGLAPAGFLALADETGVVFHWEGDPAKGVRYRIVLASPNGSESATYVTRKTTYRVNATEFTGRHESFNAFLQAVYPSARSPQIRFQRTPTTDHELEIPNDFKLKILWANLTAWMQRNLL